MCDPGADALVRTRPRTPADGPCGSDLPCETSRRLDPVAKGFPLGSSGYPQVVEAFEESGGTVDQLSHDVSMAGVALGLCGDMHEDTVKGDLVRTPPRHPPRCLQRQLRNRCVGE